MRIGELARRAGVPATRVRFYEARGLLPPPARRASGYRDYGDEALAMLAFIARARSLDFSLTEIAAHLALPEGGARKARLLALLEAKMVEIEAHLAATEKQRDTLAGLVDEVRRHAKLRSTDC